MPRKTRVSNKQAAKKEPRVPGKAKELKSPAAPIPAKASQSVQQDPAPILEEVKEKHSRGSAFPIVGIGASAGGFEAASELIEHLSPDTGMAFVLITHLTPQRDSILSELLSRRTSMPVREAKNGTTLEPNHIYVIPPDSDILLREQTLQLVRRDRHDHHMPVDTFMRSLAEEHASNAIGIILSGTGSDGALGIQAIKEAGGLTIAQTEESAKYNSMPHNAIATGCVDIVLGPAEIAGELAAVRKHPYVVRPPHAEGPETPFDHNDESDLKKIYSILRVNSGMDFSSYKQSTIRRRLARRMAFHRKEKLQDYLSLLQQNREEITLLSNEFLISVTNFFRDRGSFEVLKKKIFPAIVKNHQPDETIRIWVPGCATGEEVYSIAIVLLEYLASKRLTYPIQIFATDVSEPALKRARAGEYIENIRQDVSPERLRRYFVKGDHGYQIAKSVRDLCIFARQDITRDPPFSKVDLISCRNVLIYLGGGTRRRSFQ